MNNKGVSSEGPSITSIPKEGQSIARRSKERIPKELLEWEFMLLTTNDETWDKYFENFRMMIPERCADKSKGKRKLGLFIFKPDNNTPLVKDGAVTAVDATPNLSDDAILDKRLAIDEPLLSFWSKYASDALKDCDGYYSELREMLEDNNQATSGSKLDLHDRWMIIRVVLSSSIRNRSNESGNYISIGQMHSHNYRIPEPFRDQVRTNATSVGMVMVIVDSGVG
ncbi:hypothetical protein Tco_0257734 [Tanacetum coccineum]